MLVLAGPGSGKTLVITQRTKYLIEEYGVDPSGILVITFTRAAAREMQERFQKLMAGTARVTFGTFHAVFFSILKHAYGYTAADILREEQKYTYLRAVSYTHLDVYKRQHEHCVGLCDYLYGGYPIADEEAAEDVLQPAVGDRADPPGLPGGIRKSVQSGSRRQVGSGAAPGRGGSASAGKLGRESEPGGKRGRGNSCLLYTSSCV